MKFFQTFFLLLLLAFTTQAQNNYFTYNKLIQKAESHIMDSAYKKAIKAYKKVYQQYDKTFVRDDINAMVCALIIKDYESAVFFDKKRIIKNTPLPELMTADWQTYQQSSAYLAAKKELDSLQHYGEQLRKNSRLAFLYDSLATQDQVVRKQPNYINGKDTTILITDSLNLIASANLLKNQGYADNILWGKSQPFDIILRHNTQYSKGTLLPLIYEEVKKGNYDIYQYCFHYDEWTRHNPTEKIEDREKKFTHFLTNTHFTGVWAIVHNKLYRLKLSKTQEKIVNKNRKLLGFGTLQEAYQKQIFSTQDKRFLFSNIIAAMRHGSPQGKLGDFFAKILTTHFELVPFNLVGRAFIQDRGLIP